MLRVLGLGIAHCACAKADDVAALIPDRDRYAISEHIAPRTVGIFDNETCTNRRLAVGTNRFQMREKRVDPAGCESDTASACNLCIDTARYEVRKRLFALCSFKLSEEKLLGNLVDLMQERMPCLFADRRGSRYELLAQCRLFVRVYPRPL